MLCYIIHYIEREWCKYGMLGASIVKLDPDLEPSGSIVCPDVDSGMASENSDHDSMVGMDMDVDTEHPWNARPCKRMTNLQDAQHPLSILGRRDPRVCGTRRRSGRAMRAAPLAASPLRILLGPFAPFCDCFGSL